MDEFVPLVPVEELPDDLRAQWEGTQRPGLRDFIRMMAHAPDHFRRYNEVYGQLRFDNHLGPRLTELVRIAVAQTTRCQVCMAGRHPAAVEAGLTEELVAEIGEGERRDMTEAEFAAVTFATTFATDHLSITEADKAELRRHFTPEQIVEIGLLCVMCLVGRFSALAGLEEQWCPIE
ncbi:carboxymuconolactone decarboxylase family protein [Rhabdothermincola salaria]|uniref:carboxymuconolactone decarboxylase family protein n=1 Tax=Rhabdothermincola salaria TaxID=2903142 RepID=UPI001E38FDC4|nr:carboxymuconolactone decarboxylase family protein [Rhabdothermincola salaria]MCD9625012.1 carboxymuconolactone decarboxylase family protein [Rhabdothermincola salaria]